MKRIATWPLWWLLGLAQAQSPEQTAPVPTQQPPALYSQALQALAEGQLTQAQQLLQSVVSQHPDWPGAWLDLAEVAWRMGHYAQAEEFLLVLEQQFAPIPAPIAQAVQRLQALLREKLQASGPGGQPEMPKTQTAVVLGAGHESNANAGLRLGTIALTLPDGQAILKVDPASRAQGAAYARAAMIHQDVLFWHGARITWQVQAQTRQYQGMSAYSSTEVVPNATVQHAKLWGQITAGWQHIRLGNHSAYQTPIVRWQIEHPLSNGCQLRQHLQLESRQFLQASHLDSQWHAYRAGWQCRSGSQRRQLFVQVAQENAQRPSRTGGDSQHLSLGLQHDWHQPRGQQGHNLQLRASWQHTQDNATYSSLLDNGRPRQLQRLDWHLSWSAPVASGSAWHWSASMLGTHQKSNIAFFNQRNFALETSIWRAW